MGPTRSFKEAVQARAAKDPAFRDALLREIVDAMVAGDFDTGKALHDYLNTPTSPAPRGS